MEDKILWIVYRKGVYMQGVVGVYDSKENAETAKVWAKGVEDDNYHEFIIEEYILNNCRNLREEPNI